MSEHDESEHEAGVAVSPAADLARVIRARDFPALHEMLKHWSPPTTASLIEALSVEEQVVAFRLLPRDLAADVFEYLPLEAQERLVKAMATEEVAKILNEMAPDDRTALLDELPAAVTRQLLNLLTPQERSIAVSLLGYPEGSIGRLMTPDYVRVRPEWRVEQALEHIRRYGHDSETLSILYVIDDAGRLIGEVPIRKILLAAATARIAELMDHRVVALKAGDKQESAVPIFQHEDRVALPVTDSQGMLIGIVTVDDVLDVAESAATRTLQRFGGMEALDEPYLQMRFLSMIRRRGGWLVILFLGEMLTATAMSFFEREIERAVVLALFVPLIISSGGNSGSQAATLVIRALALGEVGLAQWWRVMFREILAVELPECLVGLQRVDDRQPVGVTDRTRSSKVTAENVGQLLSKRNVLLRFDTAADRNDHCGFRQIDRSFRFLKGSLGSHAHIAYGHVHLLDRSSSLFCVITAECP